MATPQSLNISVEELLDAIKREYSNVAMHPEKGYHFHTGRAALDRIGYMDFGLTQSDKLYMAVNGLAEWKERGPQAELRSVFSLYRETFREVFNDKDSKKICPKYPIFNLCNHDLTDFN